MNELIVADAGPLIALARIDSLRVLAQVHGRVIVPRAVYAECVADPGKPGVAEIDAALHRGWLSAQPDYPALSGTQIATLGPGESAAIELAEALNALLLMDERRGRAIATARGLRIVGTLGILIAARKRNLVPVLRPLLERLSESGYFVSGELVAAALRSVAEDS